MLSSSLVAILAASPFVALVPPLLLGFSLIPLLSKVRTYIYRWKTSWGV